MPLRVCVVGGGIMGLSTALELVQRRELAGQSISVEVHSAAWGADTTSAGAGALFHPNVAQDTPIARLRLWAEATFEYYLSLIRQGLDIETGVSLVSGYELLGIPEDPPYWADIVLGFRDVDKKELDRVGGPLWSACCHQAWHYTSIIAEPPKLLEFLRKQLEAAQVPMVTSKIDDIDSLLQERFDVVVNCSGLGSQQLLQDKSITAVRGVTLQVKAPWLRQFLRGTNLKLPVGGEGAAPAVDDTDGAGFTHVFPRSDVAVVGGLKRLVLTEAEKAAAPSAVELDNISRRAQALMPGLKHAEVVGSWAGCRPQRAEILVNVERREGSGGKPRWLANNYGHGGSGFTFWYGCAVDLADQLEAAMRSSGR